MDKKFVMTALIYALVGLALGMHMASSHNHGQLVTHAHILLIGFVVSFIYGLCHKLWLDNDTSLMSIAQFGIHQVGALVTFAGLFLLYGGFMDVEILDPILGLSSAAVFLGMLLMAVLFVRKAR